MNLIEDEIVNDSDIINSSIDFEDGLEEPDSLRVVQKELQSYVLRGRRDDRGSFGVTLSTNGRGFPRPMGERAFDLLLELGPRLQNTRERTNTAESCSDDGSVAEQRTKREGVDTESVHNVMPSAGK
ncbi:hypothetical protein TNCV_110831 [Trichonephila clavipes]|nr:hypothetical protein TNCV_110831 [Trichonephila clavipes]